MRNPLKKITAVFVLVALLPIGFIVYELSSLNENEKIVRDIYQNQLNAILYSVNQYTDDVISSWANRISAGIEENKNTSPGDTALVNDLSALLREISAVRYFYFSDLAGGSNLYGAVDKGTFPEIQATLDKLIARNSDRITRLIGYHKAGFKKMEALDTLIAENYLPVFFVIGQGDEKYALGLMVIDLPVFVGNTLGPKLQAISQDKFIIAAFQEENDSLIYSTGSVNHQSIRAASINREVDEEGQKKEFWLLPGYYLGISLKDATIDDLVKDRVNTSVVILVLLLLMLTSGIVFLYRNIRRQIFLSQSKSEFVSNVSHEIRTPLSLISMYAETLEMERVPEEKKKEYYTVIAKETARLSGIVNRILNFSEIEANQKKYDIRAVQLNDVCDEVLRSYSYHLKDKGFSYDLIKEKGLKIVYGDRESIAEAIINLLDNAIKYSRDKKHITIKTGSDSAYSFIEIIDEGIGISNAHQHAIFDKFYRAPTWNIHNTKGSGLGLALVKRTMDAHNGKTEVKSSLGKGSTFRLCFPKEDAL